MSGTERAERLRIKGRFNNLSILMNSICCLGKCDYGNTSGVSDDRVKSFETEMLQKRIYQTFYTT